MENLADYVQLALASIVFPVLVGVLNRFAERGTSKDTKARLELVGESLDVLEKLDRAAAGRPALKPEAERFEAVILGQCGDLFDDLNARHEEFRRKEAEDETFRWMPEPRGAWGYVWWFLALALGAFTVLLTMSLIYSPFDDEVDDAEFYVSAAMTVLIFAGFAWIARWAAFVAARRAEEAAAAKAR